MEAGNQQIGEATPKIPSVESQRGWEGLVGPTEGLEQDPGGLREGSASPSEIFPVHPRLRILRSLGDPPGCGWWLGIREQGAQTAAVPWAERFPRGFVQPRELYPVQHLKIFPAWVLSAVPGENPEPASVPAAV